MGTARRAPVERFGQPVAGSVPTIVRSFKSAVTKRINDLRQTNGAKLWQRNCWELIIRNEPELKSIREYVQNNQKQWEIDKLHPANQVWNRGSGDLRVTHKNPRTVHDGRATGWSPQ